MCYYEFLSNRCNCTFSNSSDHCFKEECFLNVYNEEDFHYDSECRSKCPLECTPKSLNLTHNIGVFPDSMEYNELNKTVYDILSSHEKKAWHDAHLHHSTTELSVFFKSSIYSEKTKIPKISDSEFLTIIGLTMGLFLGMCLLSLISLIDLINQFVSTIIRAIMKKKLAMSQTITVFI